MSRRIKIETFTIFQDDGHRQVFLEMGPRYNPPLDDTTVLRVGHKTTDPGGISVLLEQGDFHMLLEAVANREPWDLYGRGQTNADYMPRSNGAGELSIRWRGSGRLRTFTLDADQVDEMASWMEDRIENGWTGWKSGPSTEAQADENARTEGENNHES